MPRQPPGGRPIERGPTFGTVQEMPAFVGAAKGVFPVLARAGQYDARPDVAYVPILDGLPFEWRLIWRAAAETNRIRAFIQTAQDFIAFRETSLLDPLTGRQHVMPRRYGRPYIQARFTVGMCRRPPSA